MKIKSYRCTACTSKDFYAESVNMHMGIYCSYCGKFYKWADKNERNLIMNYERAANENNQRD